MNILENARQENCFYCADGSVIHNLTELEHKLRTMSEQAFRHHVSQSKNDFHNWIRDVFQDYELANQLLRAKTQAESATAVRKHIAKAVKAKEEIETAISSVLNKKRPLQRPPQLHKKGKTLRKRKTASAAVAASKIKKRAASTAPEKIRKSRPNRKVNKMTFLGRMSIKKRVRIRSRKRGAKSHKTDNKPVKKLVEKWLNWLKIIPEL